MRQDADRSDPEDQLSSMEQIRQDLEDADNILGVFYANKPLKRKANSQERAELKGSQDGNGAEGDGLPDKSKLNEVSDDDLYEEGPSVEWLPSSGSEGEAADKVDNLESLRD